MRDQQTQPHIPTAQVQVCKPPPTPSFATGALLRKNPGGSNFMCQGLSWLLQLPAPRDLSSEGNRSAPWLVVLPSSCSFCSPLALS